MRAKYQKHYSTLEPFHFSYTDWPSEAPKSAREQEDRCHSIFPPLDIFSSGANGLRIWPPPWTCCTRTETPPLGWKLRVNATRFISSCHVTNDKRWLLKKNMTTSCNIKRQWKADKGIERALPKIKSETSETRHRGTRLNNSACTSWRRTKI